MGPGREPVLCGTVRSTRPPPAARVTTLSGYDSQGCLQTSLAEERSGTDLALQGFRVDGLPQDLLCWILLLSVFLRFTVFST